MSRGTTYFAGLTKKGLKETIREEIARHNFEQEFESSLISDLIYQKHYYCSRKGLRPVRFKKKFRPGAKGAKKYDFYGFFPGYGWHSVSWLQCVDPRDEHDWLKRALREAIKPIVPTYKTEHPTCEKCRSVPSEEVDHVEPEFDVMASKAIQALTAAEVDDAFARFDWLSEEPFMLPTTHRAVQSVLNDHTTAKLQAVCKPCHKANADERRKATSEA